MFVLVAILLILLSPLAFILYRLFFLSRFRAPDQASLLRLRSLDGLAFLEENDLPYPSSHRHNHPLLDLSGEWESRGVSSNDGQISKPESRRIPSCFNDPNGPDREFVGPVLYEKDFVLPVDFSPQGLVRLQVESSFLNTKVFLDGREIAENHEGYLPFYVDLSELTTGKGPHRIGLLIDGSLEASSLPPRLYPRHDLGWHPYAGPLGKVMIEALPPFYCAKLQVAEEESPRGAPKLRLRALFHRRTREKEARFPIRFRILSKADASIEVSRDRDEVAILAEASVYFQEGEAYATVNCLIEGPKLRRWSPASPVLYTCFLKSEHESCELDFGLRKFENVGTGFALDGEAYFAQGACLHDCDPQNSPVRKGDSVRRDIAQMRAAGANFVRLAHYPHGRETLEACDAIGLGAWAEIPLYQAGLGLVKAIARKSKTRSLAPLAFPGLLMRTKALSDPVLIGRARDCLLKMIERDAAHPSILFWGIGNECWSFNPAAARALKWLVSEASRLDLSRPFIYAAMALPGISERFERSFEATGIISMNEYFGWYYGEAADAAPFLSRMTRRLPKAPLFVSETGADAVYGEHDMSPNPKKGPSEEYQAFFFERQFASLKRVPRWAGISVWAWRDFPCPEYREDAPIFYRNLKGLIEEGGKAKLAYRAVQDFFSREENS